jgi:hypothetical protein
MKFFVWPKDPCYQATLVPDTDIADSLPIIYFMSDLEILTNFA